MKRLLLLFMVLLLFGCSNTSNAPEDAKEKNIKENDIGITLEEFISNYNENVDFLINNDDYKEKENIPSHINIEEIQKNFDKQKNGYTKTLIKEINDEKLNHYSINAWYDDDKKLNGINLTTMGIDSDSAPELSTNAVTAGVIILESLGLDRSKQSDFFESENKDYTYTENSYKVSFLFDEDMALFNLKVEEDN